jgi:hypothetical protein
MDDLYLPRKMLRFFAVVVVFIALGWGVISGDITNAGKLMMKATEPIANRIENRLNRVLEAALPVSVSNPDKTE